MTPRLTLLISAGLVFAVGLPFEYLGARRAPDTTRPAEVVPDFAQAFAGEEFATTADVQALDQLWRALASNRRAEHDATDVRGAFVELTSAYLRLEGAQRSDFGASVEAALHALSEARERMQTADASASVKRAAWSRWQAEQEQAAALLELAAPDRPRQRLFEERSLHWLLRLDYELKRSRAAEDG